MKSVIQKDKECYVCGKVRGLHDHHILFGTANRKLSELYGLKVWLCVEHHTGSNEAVHHNKELDMNLKKLAQKYYEANYGTREDFRETFGRNYLGRNVDKSND